MYKNKFIPILIIAFSFIVCGTISAAEKSYQVTGPILEVTDTVIAVQKGNERWEIARNKDTKVAGDLKVGSKVTIHYTMTAKEVEVKEQPGGKRKD